MFVEQKKCSVRNRMVVRSQTDNINESALQSISCYSNAEKIAMIKYHSAGEAETRRYFLFSF